MLGRCGGCGASFVATQRGVGGGVKCLVAVVGNVNMLGPWKRRTAAADYSIFNTKY